MRQNRKVAPPGYLTAGQAIRLIGVPSSSFYMYVNRGEIESYTPPGRKEAFYPEVSVRRFAQNFTTSTQVLRFDVAQPEDIPAIRTLLLAETGRETHTLPTEIIAGWMRRNPQAQHVLRRSGHVIGYIAAFPLSQDTMLRRMTGEYWNRSIPMEEIRPFLPRTHVHLYIAEAVVNQELPDKEYLGFRLLRFTLDFLVEMARDEQTVMDEIYAVATTPFGIRLCRKMHMDVLSDLPMGVREDRQPCKTVVAENASRLLARYRKQVEGA